MPIEELTICRSPCGERGLKSLALSSAGVVKLCRSPCGERGLKFRLLRRLVRPLGRSPCGERGLKSPSLRRLVRPLVSLPVRGAWVEMCARRGRDCCGTSRSPCGERGLKLVRIAAPETVKNRRSPCGERGLKSAGSASSHRQAESLPVRGAWVEMLKAWVAAWMSSASLPVWGAWVEIIWVIDIAPLDCVAPRAGSVG